MTIRCEHVHRLQLRTSLGCCGNVASVPKAPYISYSRISYFGHACPKLNFVFISLLTGPSTKPRATLYESVNLCLYFCQIDAYSLVPIFQIKKIKN